MKIIAYFYLITFAFVIFGEPFIFGQTKVYDAKNWLEDICFNIPLIYFLLNFFKKK